MFARKTKTWSGWSGGAMVLGKLPVAGRVTNSRARAYCAFSRCGLGLFGHIFSRLSSPFFLLLSGRRPDIDCILSQRAVKPKTTNRQPMRHGRNGISW